MDDAHLVNLANNLGERYAGLPCREESVAAIERHLRELWPRRWRTQLTQWLATRSRADGHGARLDETVAEAIARCGLEPDSGKEE